MSSIKWPANKLIFLLFVILFYFTFGFVIAFLVAGGIIEKSLLTPIEESTSDSADLADNINLDAAKSFVNQKLQREDGHINLYYSNSNLTREDMYQTNSEALSYYLLWNVIEGNKEDFDKELKFMERNMLSSQNYLKWRIEEDGSVRDDGSNIASDADIRAIKALMLAEEQWGDSKYTNLISILADGLETVAVTEDNYLAPYGGVSGKDSIWKAEEVWISYSDFSVFRELAQRRGDPWDKVYQNMKQAVLDSQLQSGLYNTRLDERRQISNLDGTDIYSINSLWVMVRSAESGDEELMNSARKSLNFYKEKYGEYGKLHNSYSSDGIPLTAGDSPWVYAFVARTAITLDDEQFAEKMIHELEKKQISDPLSDLYGAFPENNNSETFVGQFTMQEVILTVQSFKQ